MHPESAQMIKVKLHRKLWGFFNGCNLWLLIANCGKHISTHPKLSNALSPIVDGIYKKVRLMIFKFFFISCDCRASIFLNYIFFIKRFEINLKPYLTKVCRAVKHPNDF